MTPRFAPGQTVWHIWVNPLMKTKKLLELKIQTVYPHMIIANEHRGMSYCIPLDDEEVVFFDEKKARKAYMKLKV